MLPVSSLGAERWLSRAADGTTKQPAVDGGEKQQTKPSAFGESLRRLGGELDRGERLVNQASRGGAMHLDAGQLIALQAGIYRYSEAVDLCAKLVDRATGAVKTVLQSQ